ncbi:MAG: hypothetical protein IJR25_07395 [Bacteroidales bacterium]|nr:hypothetical protein [Bacteroidales bacterium]
MIRLKLTKVKLCDTLLRKADFQGYYDALKPYSVSNDPFIIEGDESLLDTIVRIGKRFHVEAQWENAPND